MTFSVVGSSPRRIDGEARVRGAAKFADDLNFPGMLYGKVLRSKVPHGVLKGINTEKAARLEGVVAVLTARDIPGMNRIGLFIKDEPVLVDDKVRRIGDALSLVAAESSGQALEALDAIEVSIEELPGVFSPLEAMDPSAPLVHSKKQNIMSYYKVRKGRIEEALAKADVLVENTYRTPFVEHAYLETESSVARVEGDGITIWCSTQNPHYDRSEIASVLAIGKHRVRVIQLATGGGFGGKLDISTQCHAALLAWSTRRPVKLTYSREESFQASAKRHPYIIEYLSAASKEGKLLGVKVKIIADSGCYASYGPGVVSRAAVHACGPYSIPHVHVDAYGIYTNNPYCGAMRGFGVPQVAFAHESQMDILAEKLAMDPWQIRMLNFLKAGSSTATSQVLTESVGIKETMCRVKEQVAREGGAWS